MEKKTFEEYMKMTEIELSREYRERYGVRWPIRPDDNEIDENLYAAVMEKVSSGK